MENTNERRYTSSGKKVAVIATENSTGNYLVKEVYVVDGKEILLGDIFQTKELFSEPPVTWQEEKIRKIKEDLKKLESEWVNKQNEFNRIKEIEIKKLRQHVNCFSRLISTWNRNEKTEILYKTFERLSDFVLDRIQYYVVKGYSIEIQEFKKYMFDKDGEIKLISLFGADTGELNWGVNQYRDGSGTGEKVIPCKSIQEAKKIFSELIASKDKYTESEVKTAKKYRIKLDKEKIKNVLQEKWKQKEREIERTQIQLKREKEELKYLKNQYK